MDSGTIHSRGTAAMFSVMWVVTDSSRMLPIAARLAHSSWRPIPGGGSWAAEAAAVAARAALAPRSASPPSKTWSVPGFGVSAVARMLSTAVAMHSAAKVA